MKNFKVRREIKEDLDEIYQLIKTALETTKVKGGDGRDFAVKLREGKNFISELSTATKTDGKLIGYTMMTRIPVLQSSGERYTTLLVAPLSVQLKYRDLGVDPALMKEGLGLAVEMGYQAVFLTGDPNYYDQFEYQSSSGFGITCPGIPDQYVLAYELVPYTLDKVEGIIGEW